MKLSITMPAIYKVQEINPTEAYKALHQCGFRRVNLNTSLGQSDEQFQADYDAAAAGGMQVTSVCVHGNPFESQSELDFIKHAIRRTGEYGIKTVIIPLGTEQNIEHYPYLDKNEEYLKNILPEAEHHGTQVLFENAGVYQIAHYTHYAREIRLLTDRVPHPLLGVNLNVGNLGLSEAQPYHQIKLLGDLIKGVDLSDNFGAMPVAVHPERQDSQMMPLTAHIDFDQVMQALTEIGYNGICNMTVNMPKAEYATYASTGRPKCSLGITNRIYTLVYHMGQRILQSYDSYED